MSCKPFPISIFFSDGNCVQDIMDDNRFCSVLYSKKLLNFNAAKNECSRYDADLASLNTESEIFNFFSSMLDVSQGKGMFTDLMILSNTTGI